MISVLVLLPFQLVFSRYHQLEATNWEDNNLVSVIIMREPLSRLLAGDGYVKGKWPTLREPSTPIETWMEFAHDNKITNNYALTVLAGKGCCDGNNTDPVHLQHAKKLVSRFTYVLDMECLNEGMQALADQLGIKTTIADNRAAKHHHPSAKDRIPYPEVYDFLRERNKLDIELYQWSKTISLVDCAALNEMEDESVGIDQPSEGASSVVAAGVPAEDTHEAVPAGDSTHALDHEAVMNAQVSNFRDGTALMVNLHITHHGKFGMVP